MKKETNMKKGKKKKVILLILAVLIVAAAVWILWGNFSIDCEQYNISSKKIPVGFDGFRIVEIADLHNRKFGKNEERLLTEVSSLKPDIIVVTGDIVDRDRTDFDTAMDFINGAVKIAPVYYVTGNHESAVENFDELKNLLIRAGVHMMDNKCVTLSRGGGYIKLCGLINDSFVLKEEYIAAHGYNENYNADMLKSFKLKKDEYSVLLVHRPDHMETYADADIDLVFSGHAHGGQVRLPFIGGLYAPDQGFFPKYTNGLYKSGSTTMLVSRGLGNSALRVRINDTPEILTAVLHSSQ